MIKQLSSGKVAETVEAMPITVSVCECLFEIYLQNRKEELVW